MLDLLARHGRLDLDVRGQRRSADRRPPHRRGRRHLHRAGARPGARRPRRDRPLRPGDRADGRGARGRARSTSPAGGCCAFEAALPPGAIGNFDHELAEEFFRALAANARLTLHLTVEAGTNAHHMIEAAFKALRPGAARRRRDRPDRARRAEHQGNADVSAPAERSPSSTTGWATAARCRRRSSTSARGRRSPRDHEQLGAADGLVVPGVGAFPLGDAQPARARPATLIRARAARRARRCSASAWGCSCCSSARRSSEPTEGSACSPARSRRCRPAGCGCRTSAGTRCASSGHRR